MKSLIPFLVVALMIFFGCNQTEKKPVTEKYQITKQWSGTGPDFGTGDISPDGVFFTDIDWSSGDLKIINVETNEVKQLTGQGYNEGGYAWMSSFSNSGKQIAYEWYNYDTGTHELRQFSRDSSTIKTLIQASDSIYYWEPLDWTQNDAFILVAKQYTASNWEFGFVASDDGSYKPIAQLDWNAPGGMHPYAYPSAHLSPDDAYIGFDYRFENSSSNDLYLIDVQQGTIDILLQGEGDDRFLSWSSDGQEILFYSDRSGSPAIWSLRIEKGQAIGEPAILIDNIPGITPMGITKKGFAYGTRTGDFNAYVAGIDMETGKIKTKPAAVDSACYCRNNVGDWSKDGKSLLFIRFYDLPSSRESVVIKSIEDNSETEFFFPWNFHNKTGTVEWISDNEILIDGNTPGYTGVHKFNFREGVLSIPANYGNIGFFQRFKANADGSRIFVEQRWQNVGIVSYETRTGKPTTVYQGAVVHTSTAIAPKTKKLAFLSNNRNENSTVLKVMDLNTNEIETVATTATGILRPPLAWLPGDKLMTGVALSEEKKGLWIIPVNNATKKVFVDLPGAWGTATIRINPTDEKIAFQMGQGTGELFFITGL